MRKSFLCLVFLTHLLCSTEHTRAGSIAYSIVDYPTQQTDFFSGLTDHVTGMITTGGQIGTFSTLPVGTIATFTLIDGLGNQYYVPVADIQYRGASQNYTFTLSSGSIAVNPGSSITLVGLVQGTASEYAFLQWASSVSFYIGDVQNPSGQPFMGFGLDEGTNGLGAGSWTIANLTGQPPDSWTPPPSSIPEPDTLILFGLGMACMARFDRRRRKVWAKMACAPARRSSAMRHRRNGMGN